MRRALLFLFGAVAGGGSAFALALLPVHADIPPTPYAAVEVAPSRIELPVSNSEPVKREITIANLSASPETVEIQNEDFTVNSDGAYVWLAPNSTPWSIAPGLTVSAKLPNLDIAPRSTIKVDLTYFPITTTALRAGALLFIPHVLGDTEGTSSSGGFGVNVKVQAIVPVLAIPTGSDGKLDSRVKLVASPVSLDIPDALNLFGVSFIESGPIQAHAVYRNTGNAIARLDPWFAWSNLGKTFLRSESPPAVALPGELSKASASTVLTLPGQASSVDVTPMFCICTVRSSGRYVLLAETSAEASQSQLVVVAPFRIIGITLAVLGGIWWGARQARRERVRRRMVAEYLAEPEES